MTGPTPSGWEEREQELLRAIDEAAAQRARAESQSLVLERITTGAPLREVLELLVNTIEARSDGMLGSVLLLDAEGKRLIHGAAPSLPRSYTEEIDGLEIGPAEGSCGTAAYEGRQVVVEDIATDPLWENYRDLAGEHDLAACWSTPIRASSGEVLGTFALYYHEPRGPTDEELALIEEAVKLASISIERGGALRPQCPRRPPRPSDRSAEPRPAGRPAGTCARSRAPQRRAGRRPVHRPGRLQGDQRRTWP